MSNEIPPPAPPNPDFSWIPPNFFPIQEDEWAFMVMEYIYKHPENASTSMEKREILHFQKIMQLQQSLNTIFKELEQILANQKPTSFDAKVNSQNKELSQHSQVVNKLSQQLKTFIQTFLTTSVFLKEPAQKNSQSLIALLKMYLKIFDFILNSMKEKPDAATIIPLLIKAEERFFEDLLQFLNTKEIGEETSQEVKDLKGEISQLKKGIEDLKILLKMDLQNPENRNQIYQMLSKLSENMEALMNKLLQFQSKESLVKVDAKDLSAPDQRKDLSTPDQRLDAAKTSIAYKLLETIAKATSSFSSQVSKEEKPVSSNLSPNNVIVPYSSQIRYENRIRKRKILSEEESEEEEEEDLEQDLSYQKEEESP